MCLSVNVEGCPLSNPVLHVDPDLHTCERISRNGQLRTDRKCILSFDDFDPQNQLAARSSKPSVSSDTNGKDTQTPSDDAAIHYVE